MTYSFCEPVWAGTMTLVHIRNLEGKERKLGGGIDSPTLCGKLAYYGWDIEGEVTFESIQASLRVEVNPVCIVCARAWGYATGLEPDPDPRGWMRARVPAAEKEALVEGVTARQVILDEVADVGF